MNKIGIVGQGYWGKLLTEKIQEYGTFDIAWVCDRSKEGPEGIKTFKKIEKTTPVEAVIIAVQTTEHFRVAEYFLNKGIDVFLEKPIAANVEEARKLVDLATEKGATLFIDNIFLTTSCFHTLKGELMNREIKNIYARRENPSAPEKNENVLSYLNIHDAYLVYDLIGDDIFNYKHSFYLDDNRCNIYLSGKIEVKIAGSYVAPTKIRTLGIKTKDAIYHWNQLAGELYKNSQLIFKEPAETIEMALEEFNMLIGASDQESAIMSTKVLYLIEQWSRG